MEKKWVNVIIIVELVLVIVFTLLLLEGRGVITLWAISEFEEGEINGELESIVTSLDYVLGLEEEIEFYVYNDEHKNMQVLLSVRGELNNSISLYKHLIDFSPSNEGKKFKYNVKLDEFLEPGLHSAEIVALEIPKASGEGYSGSRSRVVSELQVHVPYPGKFVNADLNVGKAEINETAELTVSVLNRGKMDIEECRAIIEIFTLLGESVGSVETNSLSVKSFSEVKLKSEWMVNVLPGDYIAKIKVFYDGEILEIEKQFAVGAKNLSIEGVLVNNFQLGEIAKLQILVENTWNQNLEGVYANLIVYDKNGQVVADVRSAPEIVDKLSKKELIAYWDTVGVSEGDYNGKLVVDYSKRTEKDLVIQVSQDSLNVFGVGYTIRPRASNNTGMVTLLLILVILLLIANLSWFVFFRRTMWKKK
jgi:hypothetical protein